MGFWTAAASTAMTAGSQLMAGKAAEDDANAQAKISEYNAEISERDANARAIKTGFDQLRQVEAGDRLVGKLRARAGASGAVVSQGAPDRAITEQIVENAFDNAIIGYEGQQAESRLRSQAAGHLADAIGIKQRGKSAGYASLWKAGTTILGNMGTMFREGMFSGGSVKGPKTRTVKKSTFGGRMGQENRYTGGKNRYSY